MDPAKCSDCNHKFLLQGSDLNNVVSGGGCPSCGGNQIYRDQPSPTKSDMTSDPAQGTDPSAEGNPLKEGILADDGWQPSIRRDESYASVTHDMSPIIPWQHEASDDQFFEKATAFEKEAIVPMLLAGGAMALRTLGPKLLGNAVAKGAAQKAAPSILSRGIKAVGVHSLFNGLGKMMGGGGGAGAQQPAMNRSVQQLSHYLADTSVPSIGTMGGPEDVDPHEFNDGAHTTDPQEPTTNGIGGTDAFADPDIGQRFMDLLPEILKYHDSDASGLEHPGIRELHEKANTMQPGYHASKVSMQPGMQPGMQPVMPPVGTPVRAQPQVGPHAMTGKCPNCGSNLHGDGSCPQCGMAPQQQQQQQVAPGAQVPSSPGVPTPGFTAAIHEAIVMNSEQLAAVAELLEQQGRHDEIVTMLKSPNDYADELAQIQAKPNDPPAVDPNAPPAPPPMEGMPPEGMPPMPGGPMPPGGPPMDPSMQMAAAVARFSADNVSPRCPKCDSATTGLVDSNSARCHRCGNVWTVKGLVGGGEGGEKVSDVREHTEIEAPAIEAVPAADQEHQRDISKEQDSSHVWATDDGAPLQVGSEYEMHSDQYNIPDIIRVEAVKPNAIEYTLIGEYGLEHKTEVTIHEAQTMNYTFKPMQDHTDETDPNTDSATPAPAPGEVSDLSGGPRTTSSAPSIETPSPRSIITEAASDEVDRPNLEWLRDDVDGSIDYQPSKTAGAKFSPMEQRDFIDEVGEARNRDKLDLKGTHYETRESNGRADVVRDDDLFLGL